MEPTLSEQQFRLASDQALEETRRTMLPVADREGFEVELNQGVLYLIFEEPSETRFVVSPNAPVRQIWVSALGRSFKLAWVPDRRAFELAGESLSSLLTRLTLELLED